MNVLFDLLLTLGGLSLLYGVLGLFADLAEKVIPLGGWLHHTRAHSQIGSRPVPATVPREKVV